jgi:hypothetical protein
MRLADLILGIQSGWIRTNEEYQRSGQIWPVRARSFLVETILREMPIPRVLLHILQPRPQPPHEIDIIDGQQRCTVLAEFRSGGYALSADIDDKNNHGKTFSQLTSKQRATFDNYKVPTDRYTGITPVQIRQVFRRLNYYTAPLNAAEQRHAQFYGELARFVESQSKTWQTTFLNLRAFTRTQRLRKADHQLMAELVDAMLNGISTATAKSLRDVYQRHERRFASARNFEVRFDRARAQLDLWAAAGLRRNRLMRKHYHLFSFIMALMHSQGELASMRRDLGRSKPLVAEETLLVDLKKLEWAAKRKVATGIHAPFVKASSEKTNVRLNRLRRCKDFYRALTG